MIEEIAKFIEDHTTLTIGVDFFVGARPLATAAGTEPPDLLTILLENTGGGTDADWPDYVEKEVQAWTEGPSFFTARRKAYEVYNWLQLVASKSAWNLPVLQSGVEYIANAIEALGPPKPVDNPGEDKIFTFSANYIFRITRLP